MPSDDRPRVVAATFHNYRRVMNRKVLQLVFEVDLDREMETLATLGAPNYEAPNWYAIARLNEKPKGGDANTPGGIHRSATARDDTTQPHAEQSATHGASKPDRRPFHTLPLTQQCAIRCEDGRFHEFIDDRYGLNGAINAETCAETVRLYLQVSSRSELGRGNHEADNRWRNLEFAYQQWLTDQQYAGSVR